MRTSVCSFKKNHANSLHFFQGKKAHSNYLRNHSISTGNSFPSKRHLIVTPESGHADQSANNLIKKPLILLSIGRCTNSREVSWDYEWRFSCLRNNSSLSSLLKREKEQLKRTLPFMRLKENQSQNVNSNNANLRWILWKSRAGVVLIMLFKKQVAQKVWDKLRLKLDTYIQEKEIGFFESENKKRKYTLNLSRKVDSRRGTMLSQFISRFCVSKMKEESEGDIKSVNVWPSLFFHSRVVSPNKKCEDKEKSKGFLHDLATFNTESTIKQISQNNSIISLKAYNNIKNAFIEKNTLKDTKAQTINKLLRNVKSIEKDSLPKPHFLDSPNQKIKVLNTWDSFSHSEIPLSEESMNLEDYNKELSDVQDIKIIYDSSVHFKKRNQIKNFKDLEFDDAKKDTKSKKRVKILMFLFGAIVLCAIFGLGIAFQLREF